MDDKRKRIIVERNKAIWEKGYFRFYRGIITDPNIFEWEINHPGQIGGHTRGYAYVWLLSNATFEEKLYPFEDDYIKLEVGDYLTSQLKLMDAFKWSKKKLLTFLNYLERVGEIERITIKRNGKRATIIRMLNIPLYAEMETDTESIRTKKETKKETRTKPTKQGQNENRETDKETKGDTKVDTLVGTLGDTLVGTERINDTLINDCHIKEGGKNEGSIKEKEIVKGEGKQEGRKETQNDSFYDGKYHNVCFTDALYHSVIDKGVGKNTFKAIVNKISTEIYNKGTKGKRNIDNDILKWIDDWEKDKVNTKELEGYY